MAKRFIDTGLGRKKWFRLLSPKMKCVWRFLCDECDHAGIWEIDEDSFKYYIGETVSIEEVLATFGDRVQHLPKDNKLFVSSFVEFQYGHLNADNRVHKSVLDRLKKLHLKPLLRGSEGAPERAKDTDKDTDKDKDKRPRVRLADEIREDAIAVAEQLKRHGNWSKSESEVKAALGERLYKIAIKAGPHRMRNLRDDHFYIPNLIGLLKDANDQMQFKEIS